MSEDLARMTGPDNVYMNSFDAMSKEDPMDSSFQQEQEQLLLQQQQQQQQQQQLQYQQDQYAQYQYKVEPVAYQGKQNSCRYISMRTIQLMKFEMSTF
jgi:hypothetical protein